MLRDIARRLHLRTAVNVARATAWSGFNRATVPIRRRHYSGAKVSVPTLARRMLGLDDESAVGSRRIEIGPGPHPTPGYIHMDVAGTGPHLEAVGPMWNLPFPDAWAAEIRGIQTLEHVPPFRLLDTLREFRRVLRPDGFVHVSVPNGPAIMRAFEAATVPEKWPLMGSILGMYCAPDVRDPGRLTHPADHQLVLDFATLDWAFREAGFSTVEDRSGLEEDRHTIAWRDLCPDYCLIVRACP